MQINNNTSNFGSENEDDSSKVEKENKFDNKNLEKIDDNENIDSNNESKSSDFTLEWKLLATIKEDVFKVDFDIIKSLCTSNFIPYYHLEILKSVPKTTYSNKAQDCYSFQ